MTIKQRMKIIEEKIFPQKGGKVYVIWPTDDGCDSVIIAPGGQITKSEFKALALDEKDIVIKVVYVGVDMDRI